MLLNSCIKNRKQSNRSGKYFNKYWQPLSLGTSDSIAFLALAFKKKAGEDCHCGEHVLNCEASSSPNQV
jgi:hypothetical protein